MTLALEDVVAILTVGLGACLDSKARRISNWVMVSAVGMGLVCSYRALGTSGLIDGLKGCALGLGFLLSSHLVRGIPGDVRLLAAVGALRGPAFLLETALYGALWGGLHAMGTILLGGGATSVPSLSGEFAVLAVIRPRGCLAIPARRKRGPIPGGLVVFLGVLTACLFRAV